MRVRRNTADPAQVSRDEGAGQQCWMIVPLYDDQAIGGHVLGSNVPRLAFSADADAVALTDGVVHEPGMRTNSVALD